MAHFKRAKGGGLAFGRPADGLLLAGHINEVKPPICVTVASLVAFLYLLPLLPTFFKRHPDIQLELELSEDSVALIPKRFEVGIRAGALNDAAFVSRPLGPLRILTCASPAYMKLRGKPASPSDLANHALLQLQITGREQPAPYFVQIREGGARSLQTL